MTTDNDTNKGTLRNLFNPAKKDNRPYTAEELTRVREVLATLGYTHKPDGVYPEPGFEHLHEDYVKTNAGGAIVSSIIINLDTDGKRMVPDGKISVIRDEELKGLMGGATTISVFALLFKPSANGQLSPRAAQILQPRP